MFHALQLSLAKACEELLSGVCVEVDFFRLVRDLALFVWSHIALCFELNVEKDVK